MAIYHWESKVITRSEGRTACGAAAYMSCSEIYNEYDGVQHDYTRKGGLVWEHVFLPTMAPAEWNDREKLWNAVEATEKAKDSQLAREFIVALPVELDKASWAEILTGFIQNQFVVDGMCADVSIHDTDGHNPHAHILVTMRPLNEDGTWQYKTEKEYLCIRGGEERGFTAAEFKTAQAEGWERQYPYYVASKKKEYLTPSEADTRGLERASKYPKSTKFGRQNPITARWNSKEQIIAWRAAWADAVNRALERSGVEQRVDHRSHAERGLDEKPTVHEGFRARQMEQAGYVSDRCELNREIRADNALMRQLKETIAKLTTAVITTLADMARAMEQLRKNMILLRYHLTHLRKRRGEAVEYSRTSYRFTDLMHAENPYAITRVSKGHAYDMSSNIMGLIPELFFAEKPNDGKDYIQILGRESNRRIHKFIRRDYVKQVDNLDFYKVYVAQANGSGEFGDVLSEPVVEKPGVGSTETFLSIGKFETIEEAKSLAKYIKAKFSRALLSVLKVTQNGNKPVWKMIPLQDFTPASDIDWSQSIPEIDRQLYAKYGLDQSEIDFIESHVKEMT